MFCIKPNCSTSLFVNNFFCLSSACLLNELKTNIQAWFIYKQINMNEFFIELSNCSWSVWFIYGIGCMFVCQNIRNVVNESCSGIGCCQIDISKGMQNITLAANSFNKHTKVWDFNPCSFAFIRASEASVLNVLNAIIWHIWHTKHQKTLLMRCAKSYKFWHIWTVLFHLWNGMDRCVKNIYIYIYILFIPLSSLLLFFLSFSLTFFLLSSTACS